MRLNRNYFLLYHGLHLDKENPIRIDERINDESFFELSALLLGVNAKNFMKMQSLKSFQELLLLFTSKDIKTIQAMHHLQFSIIEHFIECRSMLNVQHLHLSFTYLLDEGILKRQEYDKLISLFDPSLFQKEEVALSTNSSENFHTNKQAFMVSLNELKEITKQDKELSKIQEYLDAQLFSVGITGVMNAGKSTMLNALMGKEILGTSVIPETANLTLIKHSSSPYAKVVYWSQSQWKSIEKSALTQDAMSSFVKETHKYYGDNLNEYIKPTALKEEINIDDLSTFTSASSSDKRSNLVSHVELGSNLHFLQEGIEIVDTPGLDDVVIQREEITKEYISKCDLMIHLMNVAQSATQKDVEFIIDAVLYQNVTKLLIVITRADLVTDKELKEVVEYTKRSISTQLHEQNSGSKLDFILQNLHFIALSGEMALLHNTGRAKEAQEKGFTLEKTGITQIEDYLEETLFSKNSQRSSLIMLSAKKQLSGFISLHLEKLSFELSLLSKNENELDSFLEEMQTKKELESSNFKEFSLALNAYEDEARVYLNSLSHFLENELHSLSEVIKDRLMSETKYSLEKEKKTAQKRRIILIIDTAIKHGLVDILRDYRYKFSKKSKLISTALENQYSDMSISLSEIKTDAFESGFLTQNYTNFHENVEKVLKSASLKNLHTIDLTLTKSIKEEFSSISDALKVKAQTLSTELLSEFFNNLKKPALLAKERLQANEELVKEHLAFSKEDDAHKHEKQTHLLKEIKLVEDVLKRCSL